MHIELPKETVEAVLWIQVNKLEPGLYRYKCANGNGYLGQEGRILLKINDVLVDLTCPEKEEQSWDEAAWVSVVRLPAGTEVRIRN